MLHAATRWLCALAAIAALALPATAASGSELHTKAKAAVTEFLGAEQPLPPEPILPLEAAQDFAAGERLLDTGILILLLVVAFALGTALRNGLLPKLPPAVFAMGVIVVLMFTLLNDSFWQLDTVTIDANGVTIERYAAPNQRIEWSAITDVQVAGGSPFPVVQDDRALRLVGGDGETYDIPRFLPGAPEAGAAVLAALERLR